MVAKSTRAHAASEDMFRRSRFGDRVPTDLVSLKQAECQGVEELWEPEEDLVQDEGMRSTRSWACRWHLG